MKDVRKDSPVAVTEGQSGRGRPDYSARHRRLEWRDQWFHRFRSSDDKELDLLRQTGLDDKIRMIKEQAGRTGHMAAYDPAGAGTPWVSIGPRNVNGRVKSIAVHPTDPGIVYAGAASGGVWKSTDGAESWRPLWDTQESLAVGSLAVAPSAPDTIYVGTGEWTPGWGPSYPGVGLYVSTDAGATWTLRADVAARRNARVLVSPANADHVFVAGNGGFERSLDAGATWSTVHAGEISDAVVDPADADTLYIAVRNDGIYKSTDGGTSWTALAAGPTGGDADWLRLAIGQNGASGSNFVVAKQSGTLYVSTDGGTSWATLAGSHGSSSFYQWCNLVAVAPDDESVLFAGGVGIERTTDGGATWSALAGLHADHHVAAFAPSSPATVYACNDGGVYRSTDQGATWEKTSDGLVVTQFYDVGSWETISTVLGGGTQDQGTNMSTGGLTWRKVFGWDGGYLVIHPTDPRTIYAEHQNTDIHKSTDGGDTWVQVTAGLVGGNPWTGVITMSPGDPNTLYTGTTQVFRTTDGCATPWATSSQVLSGLVTSIAVAPSLTTRVYAGTSGGMVVRSDDGGATSPWADITAGLPVGRPVTDVIVDRADADRVLVCLGGTSGGAGAQSVHLSSDGGATWTDISANLPDVGVNAGAFDPNAATTLYAGTDIGVFRSTDGGTTWQAFDNGLPNVVVSDLHADAEDNLLVAATFGRGMYKVTIAPGASEPAVDLYLRDSVLDTGERFPSPAGLPNPHDLADTVYWWESPDIKVEVSPYYVQDAVFDGVEFDEEVVHDDPVRDATNRFYLQVHNRGYQDVVDVQARAFFADASAGLPNLPADFWTAFPGADPADISIWAPIGPAQTIPTLEPNRPVILTWDWNVPVSAATHSCLLAVVTAAGDPITATELNPAALIPAEKRVCLKNLHVISSAGPRPAQSMVTIDFHNAKPVDDVIDIVIEPTEFSNGTIGLVTERLDFVDENKALYGVAVYPLREGEDIGNWYRRPGSSDDVDRADLLARLDLRRLFEFDPAKRSELRGVRIGAGQTIHAVVTCKGSRRVPYGQVQRFAVMQRQGGTIVGGSTYEVRLRRAAGLKPVSRIRVTLDKVRIRDDHDPFLKGAGELSFLACVGFNDDPCRRHVVRLPFRGTYQMSDTSGEHPIDACLFDGYVAEDDSMTVTIQPVEHDLLDPDDPLCRFARRWNFPPETWVGRYGPADEPAPDAERVGDWDLWYRIESLRQ